MAKVKITVENGALGRTATTADGVAGLVVCATAKPNLGLYVPKLIFSLKEAENLGLTEANDQAESVDAWQQIKEFYDEAGNGATLWIMTYAMERTLTEMTDPANTGRNSVRTLLNASEGAIRMLAIGHYINPNLQYNPVIVGGIDGDVHTAAQNLNALALEYQGRVAPFVALVDARGWNGSIGNLRDLHTLSYPKVQYVLATTKKSKRSACVGLALGRYSKLPVQRHPGRVKDGAVQVARGFMTTGEEVKDYAEADLEAIAEKGYLIFTRYNGKSGLYFSDDSTATTQTDDYLTIANNRVIHKAYTIAYSIFVEELNDEVSIAADGKIAPTQLAYLKQKIGNAIDTQMLANKNIANYQVEIDPNQDVIKTDKVMVTVRIVPVGKLKFIDVSLGFKNPTSASA